MRQIGQAEIARQIGVSRVYVHDVLHGRRRSDRIEAAIAEAIGRPVAEVFPPRVAPHVLTSAA